MAWGYVIPLNKKLSNKRFCNTVHNSVIQSNMGLSFVMEHSVTQGN